MDTVFECLKSGLKNLDDSFTLDSDVETESSDASLFFIFLFKIQISDLPDPAKYFIDSAFLRFQCKNNTAPGLLHIQHMGVVGWPADICTAITNVDLNGAANIKLMTDDQFNIGDVIDYEPQNLKVETHKIDPNALVQSVRMGVEYYHVNLRLSIGIRYKTYLCNRQVKPLFILKWKKVLTEYKTVGQETLEVG